LQEFITLTFNSNLTRSQKETIYFRFSNLFNRFCSYQMMFIGLLSTGNKYVSKTYHKELEDKDRLSEIVKSV